VVLACVSPRAIWKVDTFGAHRAPLQDLLNNSHPIAAQDFFDLLVAKAAFD
jgi:hypothetical protein